MRQSTLGFPRDKGKAKVVDNPLPTQPNAADDGNVKPMEKNGTKRKASLTPTHVNNTGVSVPGAASSSSRYVGSSEAGPSTKRKKIAVSRPEAVSSAAMSAARKDLPIIAKSPSPLLPSKPRVPSERPQHQRENSALSKSTEIISIADDSSECSDATADPESRAGTPEERETLEQGQPDRSEGHARLRELGDREEPSNVDEVEEPRTLEEHGEHGQRVQREQREQRDEHEEPTEREQPDEPDEPDGPDDLDGTNETDDPGEPEHSDYSQDPDARQEPDGADKSDGSRESEDLHKSDDAQDSDNSYESEELEELEKTATLDHPETSGPPKKIISPMSNRKPQPDPPASARNSESRPSSHPTTKPASARTAEPSVTNPDAQFDRKPISRFPSLRELRARVSSSDATNGKATPSAHASSQITQPSDAFHSRHKMPPPDEESSDDDGSSSSHSSDESESGKGGAVAFSASQQSVKTPSNRYAGLAKRNWWFSRS